MVYQWFPVSLGGLFKWIPAGGFLTPVLVNVFINEQDNGTESAFIKSEGEGLQTLWEMGAEFKMS